MFNKIEKINNELFVQTENVQEEVMMEKVSKFGFKGIIEKVRKVVIIPAILMVGITFSSLIGCGNNPMIDNPSFVSEMDIRLEQSVAALEKENASLRAIVGESDIPVDDYISDLNTRVEVLENENKDPEAKIEVTKPTVIPEQAVCDTDADCAAEQVKETTKPTTTVTVTTADSKKPSAKAIALGSEMININTASLSDLERLPGVGEKTAQAIIDGRPYLAIEDILDVKGIGEKKFEGMKNNICVDCE